MKQLNRDEAARNKILEPYAKSTTGSYWNIDNVPLNVLELLLAQNFLDPDLNQNYSPTIAEFMVYMRAHPGCLAHGYVINLDRDDYRISIEGLRHPDAQNNLQSVKDFVTFCQGADELIVNDELYAWWD